MVIKCSLLKHYAQSFSWVSSKIIIHCPNNHTDSSITPSPTLSIPLLSLIDTARISSISTMHTPSSRSLQPRPPGQASPQLHQSTRHLVTHGRVALVVVHRRSGGMVTARTSGACCLGGGCSGGGSSCTAGSVCALGAQTETALQRRAGGCAGGASSARGRAAGGCKRHGELIV